MNRRTWISMAAVATVVALAAGAGSFAGPAQRVADALWGDGVTWDTILTDTSFRQPPSHSTDKLYNFSMSGLTGQRSVAESSPGQPDYNGGRWWVQMVVFTEQGLAAHDPDGDGQVNFELTSAEDVANHVELGHLEIHPTSTYFECPMLRGGR